MVKKVVIVPILLAVAIFLKAQCLPGDSLQKKINFLRDSSKLSATDQIKALSPYETAIANCTYKHDSVHVQLLQLIGRLYSSLANYPKAVDYFLRSIDLVNRNAGRPLNNPRDLIRTYYWLSGCYDSLQRTSDKLKAYDSCASIAVRLRSIDAFCLWPLLRRTQYFYDVGDFHRCISNADLCESLAMQLANSGSKPDFDLGTDYALSSLVWKINALMALKRYDEARSLLEKKANESTDKRLEHNLGVIYGSLAEVLEFKGDFEKVLYYQSKAFAIERKSGAPINCKAMLNDVGYEVWFKHYKNLDKALEYYDRALQYPVNDAQYRVLNSMESLRIMGRIANVFTLQGKYDEALKNFQLAFDKIK